jgi:ankyrin repeat protein
VLAQTAPEEIAAAEPFMGAFRLLQQSDVSSLARLLQQHPELATAHGTNGNTLLNLAVSLASKMDESAGIAAIETLLRAGADCGDANARCWTPLHQAAYSNQTAIGARLVEAGASLEADAH